MNPIRKKKVQIIQVHSTESKGKPNVHTFAHRHTQMETHRDAAKRNYCLYLLLSRSRNIAFSLCFVNFLTPGFLLETLFSLPLSLTPISPTCCERLWNVNCPLKTISVWNVALSNSEEDINTPALLHLPPQINSLLSRPALPLYLFHCVCTCVCGFRYLSQFGMRALQLHTDQTRWRDKEEEGKKGRERQKERAAWGCWHLTGLLF